MEEIDVWVGPVVHKSILRFYIIMLFFHATPGGVFDVIWTSSYFLYNGYAGCLSHN